MPDLKKIHKVINATWTRRNNEFGLKIDHNIITLQDCYDFFFNDKRIVEKILRCYSRFHVPIMIECIGKKYEKQPFEFNYLFPMANLILGKLDKNRDSIMENWAFILGRMFREANNMHRAMFAFRNMRVPDELIGHKAMRQAILNPSAALARFSIALIPCQKWAESPKNWNNAPTERKKECYFDLNLLKQLSTKLYDGGNVPMSISDCDKIQLMMGYNYWEKQQSNEMEKKI